MALYPVMTGKYFASFFISAANPTTVGYGHVSPVGDGVNMVREQNH